MPSSIAPAPVSTRSVPRDSPMSMSAMPRSTMYQSAPEPSGSGRASSAGPPAVRSIRPDRARAMRTELAPDWLSPFAQDRHAAEHRRRRQRRTARRVHAAAERPCRPSGRAAASSSRVAAQRVGHPVEVRVGRQAHLDVAVDGVDLRVRDRLRGVVVDDAAVDRTRRSTRR